MKFALDVFKAFLSCYLAFLSGLETVLTNLVLQYENGFLSDLSILVAFRTYLSEIQAALKDFRLKNEICSRCV